MGAAVIADQSRQQSDLLQNLRQDISSIVDAEIDKMRSSTTKGPYWDLAEHQLIKEYLFDASNYPLERAIDEGIALQRCTQKAKGTEGSPDIKMLESYVKSRISRLALTYLRFVADPLIPWIRQKLNGEYAQIDKVPLLLDVLKQTNLANAIDSPVALVLLQKNYASKVHPRYAAH